MSSQQYSCNTMCFRWHADSKVSSIQGIEQNAAVLLGGRKIVLMPLHLVRNVELPHRDWWNNLYSSSFLKTCITGPFLEDIVANMLISECLYIQIGQLDLHYCIIFHIFQKG